LPDGPGFHGVTLSLADHAATAELLTALLGYEAAGKEGNTYRYAIPTTCPARFVDVVKLPGGEPALQGGGSVHHVAYSVPDRAAQGDVKQLSFGSRVAEEEIDDPQGYFVERHDLLTQW
jgi:glyoxalase family protein